MTNSGGRLGLLLLTLLVASSAAEAQSVGNDGSLSYGYTFPLPAARGRYQPVLGLSYSSSSQGDYSSGLGWALSLSYIDTSTRATLTTSGAPRTQLWLVMNGSSPQLLAPVSGTTFRPDIDSSYHLVTEETLPGLALTTPPEGIGSYYVACKFLMTDSVGNTFCFGSPTLPYPNSTHINPNRAFLLAVYDVDSNFTLYDYTTEDTIDGTGVLLAGIRYSQFLASTGFMAYAYHATLTYVAQPNPVATEVAGEFVFHSQTLSSVTIKYGESPNFVTEYSLAYSTESTETSQPGRQLLQNVTIVNSAGASFDSGTSFSYVGPIDGPLLRKPGAFEHHRRDGQLLARGG